MNGDDITGNREQWGGRTWTLIAALIVVALVIGAGVWVLALRDDDDTATTTPQPSSPAATVTELPEGFVGGRDIVDGVPVGFSHDQAGAISAAVTWTGMAFIYPRAQRAPGITNVFTDTAPPLDPETPSNGLIISATPIAVRGTVEADTGVVEVLSAVTGDFVNGLPPESDQLAVDVEIIALTLVWDAGAEDWRISAWSRRTLAPGEFTPGNLAGFQLVRSIGSLLTTTPIGVDN
jgi:hypothetical protein